MMNIYNFLLFVFFFSLTSLKGIAQNTRDVQSSIAIDDLKKGVLIIIIPSHHNKINVLKKSLNDPKLSKKKKKRARKLLEVAQEEKNTVMTTMYDSFQENYNFSDFAFIYDTATVHILKRGVRKGIFIKNNDEIDLTGKPVFFLRYGHTDQTNTTGIEAWVVTDNQLDDLQRPFPYYVPVPRSLKQFLSAFTSGIPFFALSNNKAKVISRRLNNKFWDYYNRINTMSEKNL